MKEVTTVSLGGVVLSLELDAKDAINIYLDKNRAKLKGNEAADEIISDLEAAIGAHLIEKGYGDKLAANKKAVQDVLGTMGEVDADSDGEEDSRQDWREFFKQPFRLSKTNKVIFGLAGGIAERLDISAFWVRMAFVFMAFITDGWMVWFYLIVGFVMSVTEADEPVNAKTVAAQVERASKAASQKVLARSRQPVKRVDHIVRIALRAFAVAIAMAGIVAALSALSWALVTMGGRPEFDMPFIGTTRSLLSYVFVVSGLLGVAWLFGLLMASGMVPAKSKQKTNKPIVALLILVPSIVLVASFAASIFNMRGTVVDWSRRHPGNRFVEIYSWENDRPYNICISPVPTCQPATGTVNPVEAGSQDQDLIDREDSL